MKLGQLKEALKRFPADMDDLEVALITAINGQRNLELLAGVGYIPAEENTMPAIVGTSEIHRRVDEGEMPKSVLQPKPTEEGEEWKQNG